MALTAQSIIHRATGTLNNLSSGRWTIPALCRYFNDGQRDILMQRPDARNLRITHPLVDCRILDAQVPLRIRARPLA